LDAAGIRHRTIRTNGIRIHIAEAGSGPVVLLLHGFPELWYSWRAAAGDRFHYILYFQGEGKADRELARDPRRTLARILWSVSGDAPRGSARPLPREGTAFLDGLSDAPRLPPWLSEEDLDVYASAFRATGFTGGPTWYRNLDRNWELTEHQTGRRVTIPSLFVAGERDPVLQMMPPSGMDGWVDDLRGSILIPEAGHWVQQERPDEVNRSLLAFLATTGGR
jgi:epoxide hydrolase A/B